MTQLILDKYGENITLPESQKDGYFPEKSPLAADVEMISGRVVRELRGTVWVIRYQYGYFDTATKDKVLAACEKGQKEPIYCDFLTQESAGELTEGRFWVTELNRPKFMWARSDNGTPVPIWADFSFTLREVKPSD
jgi:hypothetical protein